MLLAQQLSPQRTQPPPKFLFDSENHKYYANGYISWFAKQSGEALERGTDLHLITALYDQNILESYPRKYDWVPKVWQDFLDREQLDFEFVEFSMYDKENGLWCGTLDRAGYDENGERVIWDIYTGQTFPRYKHIQTMSYKKLLVQSHPEYANARREGIVLRPNGVKRVSCPDDVKDEKAWWAALQTYYYKLEFSPSLLAA